MPDFLYTQSFWEVTAVLAVTAAACSILGAFLVLRRMALLTDAIGHVLLLGIVAAFLVTHDLRSPLLVLGAAATGLITVALVEAVSRSKLVKEDTAIGLVFPALFAVGVLLATLYTKNTHLDVDRVLLGIPELAPLNRLVIGDTAQPGDVSYDLGPTSFLVMAGMFLVNAAYVIVCFKELKLSTFDALLASTLGFLPGLLHYLLMGLVSLTAVTAFDAAGPVLVVAFFIVPAATAYLLTDRLGTMIVLSITLAVIGAFLGTCTAYFLGTTISGTVAVTMGVIFVVTLFGSPRHGLIARAQTRWRQRRKFFETMLAIHLHQHEGTPEEADESLLLGLHEHLGWLRLDTKRVARRLVEQGWAVERNGRLVLTNTGRSTAQAAIGSGSV